MNGYLESLHRLAEAGEEVNLLVNGFGRVRGKLEFLSDEGVQVTTKNLSFALIMHYTAVIIVV